MAGDVGRDGVGSAGGADGSDGVRRSDGFGELAVGAGFATGDGSEGVPYALLEGGGADVERELPGCGGFGHVG